MASDYDAELDFLVARAQARYCLAENGPEGVVKASEDVERLVAEVRLLRSGIESTGGHRNYCPKVWNYGAKPPVACECPYGLLHPNRKLGDRAMRSPSTRNSRSQDAMKKFCIKPRGVTR